MNNTALLIIDAQRGIFHAEHQPYQAEAMLNRLQQLQHSAKQRGMLSVLVHHEATGVVEYNTEAWQLADGLVVTNDDIRLRKTTPDAFFNTDLHQQLQARAINKLVIAGFASDFCIDRSSFAAANLGYQVQLVSDGHTTYNKPHLDAVSIIAHHNFTLSKHPNITLISCAEWVNG